MKKVIIVATKIEALPFINGLKLKKESNKIFQIFSNNNLALIISGIGKASAALAVSYAVLKLDAQLLYNFGSCGALKNEFVEAQIFHVSKIIELDRPLLNNKKRFIFPDKFESYAEAIVATQDHAVITKEERTKLSEYADIADMEAAGFSQACKLFNKKGYIFKIVSDTKSLESSSDIIENIKKVSISLYEYIASKKILT